MNPEEWQFVLFTFIMALSSTLIVIPVGLTLAYCLAKGNWPGKLLLDTLVTLPPVLPPVVTGLVLLKAFGRRGPLGHWLHQHFGLDIVFTWRAVILALVVMSLPLFVRAARSALEGVNPAVEQIARTLGANEWRVFFTVSLPLARRGVLAGTLLALARAMGEFGATILVAGNIPGKTTTLSVAIYQHIQLGENGQAWALAAISAVLAFLAVAVSQLLVREQPR
jgi:molybdate transport system permease protein